MSTPIPQPTSRTSRYRRSRERGQGEGALALLVPPVGVPPGVVVPVVGGVEGFSRQRGPGVLLRDDDLDVADRDVRRNAGCSVGASRGSADSGPTWVACAATARCLRTTDRSASSTTRSRSQGTRGSSGVAQCHSHSGYSRSVQPSSSASAAQTSPTIRWSRWPSPRQVATSWSTGGAVGQQRTQVGLDRVADLAQAAVRVAQHRDRSRPGDRTCTASTTSAHRRPASASASRVGEPGVRGAAVGDDHDLGRVPRVGQLGQDAAGAQGLVVGVRGDDHRCVPSGAARARAGPGTEGRRTRRRPGVPGARPSNVTTAVASDASDLPQRRVVALGVLLAHVDLQVGDPLGVLGLERQGSRAEGVRGAGEHVLADAGDRRPDPLGQDAALRGVELVRVDERPRPRRARAGRPRAGGRPHRGASRAAGRRAAPPRRARVGRSRRRRRTSRRRPRCRPTRTRDAPGTSRAAPTGVAATSSNATAVLGISVSPRDAHAWSSSRTPGSCRSTANSARPPPARWAVTSAASSTPGQRAPRLGPAQPPARRRPRPPPAAHRAPRRRTRPTCGRRGRARRPARGSPGRPGAARPRARRRGRRRRGSPAAPRARASRPRRAAGGPASRRRRAGRRRPSAGRRGSTDRSAPNGCRRTASSTIVASPGAAPRTAARSVVPDHHRDPSRARPGTTPVRGRRPAWQGRTVHPSCRTGPMSELDEVVDDLYSGAAGRVHRPARRRGQGRPRGQGPRAGRGHR